MLNIAAIQLSLELALITTLVLLIIGIPIAWWLSRINSAIKPFIESIIALPLVLPPTVIGFYLLVLLGAQGPFADWGFIFSFKGLVIGSVIYSLPFVVQPLQNAFQKIDLKQLEAAATLRASARDRFFSIALPQARYGLLTAMILGFTHTLGEFGIILMIGGNIPGKTQTVSIAIFDHVEQLEYTQAHILSAGLLAFSFIVLLIIYNLSRRQTLREQA